MQICFEQMVSLPALKAMVLFSVLHAARLQAGYLQNRWMTLASLKEG